MMGQTMMLGAVDCDEKWQAILTMYENVIVCEIVNRRCQVVVMQDYQCRLPRRPLRWREMTMMVFANARVTWESFGWQMKSQLQR